MMQRRQQAARKLTEPLALMGVFWQPCEWSEDDQQSVVAEHVSRAAHPHSGVGDPVDQVRANNQVKFVSFDF